MRRAWCAGIRVLSVTDHDTTAATAEAAGAAARYGIECVPGIEITAVVGDTDVHVLGYFIDSASPTLASFLADQRAARLRRIRRIAARLTDRGLPVDADRLIADAQQTPGAAVGRPHVAQAMVRARHVASVREAFDRYLAEGRPGYVPHEGASPAAVVELIGRAGGIASLAHPGLLRRDALIGELAAVGLSAVEAYHSEHDAETSAHYVRLAGAHGLAVSGGSDYHGDADHGAATLGAVSLPPEHYERLRQRAAHGDPAGEARLKPGPT